MHLRFRLRRSRGVTLFELIVALFILMAAMATMVQLLAVTARQRRIIQQRQMALSEVANQAERISLLPWSETSPDTLTDWKLADSSRVVLAHATPTIAIREEMEPVRGRRIRLLVRLPNAAGQEVDLADLTVWKFASGGEP